VHKNFLILYYLISWQRQTSVNNTNLHFPLQIQCQPLLNFANYIGNYSNFLFMKAKVKLYARVRPMTEGVGVGVGVGGLVGSVLGIGWLGWQLGGTADFDAFRAVCMHSLQLQMPDC
jgi:hypothetical protein